MLRRLLADSAVYSVAAAIPGVAGIVLLPIYTRFLRPQDYGLVDLVTLTYAIVSVVATFEISQGLARHLPEASNLETRRRFTSTAFWFTLATMLIAVAIIMLAAPQIAPAVLQKTDAAALLRVGGATALVGAVYGVVLRQLRWALRPRAYLAVTAVATIVTAAATLLLLIRCEAGPVALLLGQAIGSTAGLALAASLVRAELAFTWDGDVLRQMLRFSFPLVASTLGVLAAGQASRWIVAHQGSLDAAGLFGVAIRVASILAFAASGLQLSLAPLIYASHRQAQTPANLAKSFRLFAAGGLVLWAMLTLFAPEILRVLVTTEFQNAAALVGPIAAALLITTATMFAPGLEIAHQTSRVAGVCLLSGAINVIFGWVWVPRFGAGGAGAAMCLSAVVQAAFIFRLSQQRYLVPHRWNRLAAAVALAAIIAMPGWAPEGFLPLFNGIARALLVVLLGAGCWWLLVRQSAPLLGRDRT